MTRLRPGGQWGRIRCGGDFRLTRRLRRGIMCVGSLCGSLGNAVKPAHGKEPLGRLGTSWWLFLFAVLRLLPCAPPVPAAPAGGSGEAGSLRRAPSGPVHVRASACSPRLFSVRARDAQGIQGCGGASLLVRILRTPTQQNIFYFVAFVRQAKRAPGALATKSLFCWRWDAATCGAHSALYSMDCAPCGASLPPSVMVP